jgi:predicted nucleic acid-binding protein
VIALDAQAVLALLKAEPGADEVLRLLESGEQAALTPLGVAEVLDHLVRRVGANPREAVRDLAQLGLTDPVPLDDAVAARAGLLRARQYHRRERPISLADCVLAETARSLGASVATSDPHLLDTCRAEGISAIPLPDSQGRVPSA